ncbi:hypothetical protein FEM48_Zijuj06G0206800 [Ziziphus jujuba var. spinosa]|uniref:Protein ECERIFERUM 1-like n=1 Tax=Ziziphus jujuba var. spinosa TaxID=714518 RepID=A0A978VBI1_ZIZJJ|nr:hypothetical protein FEM48_Zijuj06G0206800 [Ziziphus jujuba var. spinosa]
MATTPGILTDWPWKPLGNFKYVILAPWAMHSTYSFIVTEENEKDLGHFLIFPYLLLRMLHNQIWISLSRYQTAKGAKRIVDKGIEFEQVDRERNWDDQILLNGLVLYIGYVAVYPLGAKVPLWRTDGVIITALLHTGPVEFLYYWFHRALHHHFLYNRYHSHHHASIVTEPITSVIHPFAEHIVYYLLFTIPLLTTVFTRTASIASFAGYIFYIDFMNNMGHCNFELVPKSLFSVFPILKFFMYTPSFHSLHHTQFRSNYSLFMPIYDIIYGTVDESTDGVYKSSLEREEESGDVVHLTHLTTPDSIYHLRLGLASMASNPFNTSSPCKWYLWLLWPLTCWFVVIINWIKGRAFISESNSFKNLKVHSWVVPRYKLQYLLPWRKEAINKLIEEAILDADKKGVKGEELNRNGELYIKRNPQLKIKVVDGSSLAMAVVLNSIPKGTTKVLLRGNLNKVAFAIANSLCQRGIEVATINREESMQKLKEELGPQHTSSLIWLVGDGWNEEEQMMAKKGTIFIPFSQFPPKKLREDCFYFTTPAMVTPSSLKNMHSCENWLPRRVMSAWRIAGILHVLEGWNINECGDTIFNIDQVWRASIQHGFHPLDEQIINKS